MRKVGRREIIHNMMAWIVAVHIWDSKSLAKSRQFGADLGEYPASKNTDKYDLSVVLPAFIESGYSVPVSFTTSLPASAYPVRLKIIAPANPNPDIMSIVLHAPEVTTLGSRIRLARSQTVTIEAEMADGEKLSRQIAVDVVVGGCDTGPDRQE